MKLSDRPISNYRRILIYGGPKVGKTQLAGGLSEKYNLHWVDLENGAETLKKLPIFQQERIDLLSLPDTRSWPVAIKTCLKIIKGGKHEVCDAHGKIACAVCKKSDAPFTSICVDEFGAEDVLVFDSLTQLTQSAISNITKSKPDDYKMEYDDWANLGKLMDMFLSHVQQAKYNVVCISHESEAEMEDGKMRIVPVAGTRNFSRNTAKYFDDVVYAEVKNGKHVFASSTTYRNNIQTGSRAGVAMETSEAPSLLQLFEAVKPKEEQPFAARLSGLKGGVTK